MSAALLLKQILFAKPTPDASPFSCGATVLVTAVAYYLAYQLCLAKRPLEPPNLSERNHIEWHSRLLSTVSALLVLAVSAPAVPEAIRAGVSALDCYFGYSICQDIACRLFIGFLFFDLWHMVAYRSVIKDAMFAPYLVHHLLFAGCGLYAVSGSYFRWHFLWLIAGEASNPLINLRWHMAVLGYKGWLYIANGVLAALVFGGTRVVLFGAGLWHILQTREIWLDKSAPTAFKPVVSLIFVAYFLNVYWFWSILKALYRAVNRKASNKKKSQ